MNKDNASLNTHLQALDTLLVRERRAITHLRMGQLNEIQQEKIKLLHILHQVEPVVDAPNVGLINSIKVNNERNRMLLESGLKLVKRLQGNVFRRLALTYAAHGRSLAIGAGPRLLNRSV